MTDIKRFSQFKQDFEEVINTEIETMENMVSGNNNDEMQDSIQEAKEMSFWDNDELRKHQMVMVMQMTEMSKLSVEYSKVALNYDELLDEVESADFTMKMSASDQQNLINLRGNVGKVSEKYLKSISAVKETMDVMEDKMTVKKTNKMKMN